MTGLLLISPSCCLLVRPYVKNKEAQLRDTPDEVAGMLLYAKTDEAHHPDHVYSTSGNTITVRTLDLNQDFSGIAYQLDSIVYEYFTIPAPLMRPVQYTGGTACIESISIAVA